MTNRKLLAALATTLLAACGSDSDTVFTATSGSYRTFSASPTSANSDGCNMAWTYSDPNVDPFGLSPTQPADPIYVTVNTAAGTVDLNPLTTGVGGVKTVAIAINGALITTTGASNWEKNVIDTDCNYDQTDSLTGDITANDELALTLTVTKTRKSGTCHLDHLYILKPDDTTATGPEDANFTTCTTSIQFLATRTGPIPAP